FLDRDDRYRRADEFVETARDLWDTWRDGAVVADAARGVRVVPDAVAPFEHRGHQCAIEGTFDVPRSPQGYPVMIQAGDSDGGRALAAKRAVVVFSAHCGFAHGEAFYEDVKQRLGRHGRGRDDLKIIPAATATIGDTD